MDELILPIAVMCMTALALLLIIGAIRTARMSKKERRRELDEFDDAW